MERNRLFILRLLVVLGLVVSTAAACSTANRGGLHNSREVGRAFDTLHAFPNHRYWYYVNENSPYAVVGLNAPYRLEDKLWTEVDPESKTFEKVVGLVKDFPVRGSFTYGAYILDPQGQQIGVWYSSMNAGVKVDLETKLVSITTGMPWADDDRGYGSGVGIGVGSGGAGVGVRIGF
ncbi:MAG: hypothetical protein R6V84_02335 [Desulfobacterales bacterium]